MASGVGAAVVGIGRPRDPGQRRVSFSSRTQGGGSYHRQPRYRPSLESSTTLSMPMSAPGPLNGSQSRIPSASGGVAARVHAKKSRHSDADISVF